MPMTTREYQNKLALKMIRSFVNDLYNKTGMKAMIKIDRLSLPTEDNGNGFHDIISLDILEKRFLECIPFNLETNPLKARSRKGEYVDLRCVFCHLACKHLGFSLVSIARYLKKDHTSIIHMNRRAEILLENDERFIRLYDSIFIKINLYVEFSKSDSTVYNPERVLPASVH